MKVDEGKILAAFRAAGYCGAPYQEGKGRCTREPGTHSDGHHVDYYNGRRSPSDTAGYRWPQ
ncbi:hypothetical protein [Streptomyces sp. MK5]|uniref:hypothetical protein n=1 Tax=Streptomyces sp. MK5 TaxID=3064253 RepID=UPI002741865E|nr:hypothetical protein [Streptomyces sp. MK5]